MHTLFEVTTLVPGLVEAHLVSGRAKLGCNQLDAAQRYVHMHPGDR